MGVELARTRAVIVVSSRAHASPTSNGPSPPLLLFRSKNGRGRKMWEWIESALRVLDSLCSPVANRVRPRGSPRQRGGVLLVGVVGQFRLTSHLANGLAFRESQTPPSRAFRRPPGSASSSSQLALCVSPPPGGPREGGVAVVLGPRRVLCSQQGYSSLLIRSPPISTSAL